MAIKDKFAKDHPSLEKVDPHHLSFAFHQFYGLQRSRIASIDPLQVKLCLETNTGTSLLSFTDIPYNRIMLRLHEELELFYPQTDPNSLTKITAIIIRINAISRILGKDGFPGLIERNDDGSFFLGPKAVATLATASLSRSRGLYKRKSFIRHYKSANTLELPPSLNISLPPEMIFVIPKTYNSIV